MADLSTTPMLDQLRAGFAAHGWNPDHLDRYRMEEGAAGDAGAGAAAAASGDAGAQGDGEASAADDLGKFGEHGNYIKELRAENAKYRTERNQARDENGRYAKAFEGVDDATVQTVLGLPSALRSDPKGTAAWLKTQAEEILANFDDAAAQAEATGEDMPLTRAEVQKMLAEQAKTVQHEQAVARELDNINAQAKTLGYEPDTRPYRQLLVIASEETGGDLTKADELLKAERQSIIDGHLASLRDGAATSAKTPPQAGASRQEKSVPAGFGSDFRQYVRDQIAAR